MEAQRAVTYFFYFLFFGDFLLTSARRIRKTCMDSEMEIFSPHGVYIEPYPKSHVEMNLMDITRFKARFHIQMEFKTKKPDGVLFYTRFRRNAGELISMTLQGGNLIYKLQCPSLHADILIPSPSKNGLNDGRWHTLRYTVRRRPYGQYGVVEIDGSSGSKRYEVTCKQMRSVVVGGLSPKDAPYVKSLNNLPGHFEGCIRNLQLPYALRSPPKYYAVSVCG